MGVIDAGALKVQDVTNLNGFGAHVQERRQALDDGPADALVEKQTVWTLHAAEFPRPDK